MPRITDKALMSYETVSQALISLGRFYYENYHDNPDSDTKSLFDVIDKCLLDVEATEPKASIEHAANQSENLEAAAVRLISRDNELASTGEIGDFPQPDRKTSKQCPYCDAPLPDDAVICATCGSSLS